MSKVLATALSFFSAGIISGFIIGRATSPDSNNPATAEQFVAVYAKWTRIDSEHGSLTVRARNHIYSYSTGSPNVSTSFLSALEMAEAPAPTLRFDQDVEKLATLAIATPATGILYTLAKGLRPDTAVTVIMKEHQATLIAALVATIGGAGVGYYLGHKTNPDYDNSVFQKTIHETQLWRDIEKQWRQAYTAAVLIKSPCLRARPESVEVPPKPGTIRVRNMMKLQAERAERQEDEAVLQRVFSLHPEIANQVDSDPRVTGDDPSCR